MINPPVLGLLIIILQPAIMLKQQKKLGSICMRPDILYHNLLLPCHSLTAAQAAAILFYLGNPDLNPKSRFLAMRLLPDPHKAATITARKNRTLANPAMTETALHLILPCLLH